MAAASIKTANALAILDHYEHQIWLDIVPLLELIPENKKEVAKVILREGKLTSSFIIDGAMDTTNTGFRKLAGGAVLRRLVG